MNSINTTAIATIPQYNNNNNNNDIPTNGTVIIHPSRNPVIPVHYDYV
jgi:hypothetical protein